MGGIDFTVHCMVKDEDCWVWFALQSVLPYAKKIIIFDTGSSDGTIEVIKTIKSPKIYFEKKEPTDRKGLAKYRQEMIDMTDTAWFLILDGDEIWPKAQLEKLLKIAADSKDTLAFANYTRNALGDVYHYLPENSGRYQIAGKVGNLTIRLIRKTKDLIIKGEYPLEAYSDHNGPIQDQPNKIKFVDCWYLHTTYLQRSSYVTNKTSGSLGKIKFPEMGINLREDHLPEVLTRNDIPKEVPIDPLKKRKVLYQIQAFLFSPLIFTKRKLE